MANAQLQRVLQQVRTVVAATSSGPLSDRQLLERFAADRDEGAFTALVKRHAAMVLNVCRRVLHNATDAEDACQAAFWVLARKARSIRKKDAVVSWLHGVAHRAATNLRRENARRQARERRAATTAQVKPSAEVTWREIQTILDDEIQRLPANLKGPVLLCYLEGKTHNEGAQELGVNLTTFRGRLERARALLRQGLQRRGVTLSGALLAVVMTDKTAAAALPVTLVVRTVQAVLTGKASAAVRLLCDRLVTGVLLARLARTLAVLVVLGLVALGVGQTLPGTTGPLAAPVPGAAGAKVKEAKQPATTQEQVRALVQHLGSSSFKKRAAAQQKLLELGPAIVPWLDQVQGPDLETQLRLEEIRYQLTGFTDDIVRFLESQSPAYEDARVPVPDHIKALVAAHQPRSGNLLLGFLGNRNHKLNWPATNLFVQTWDSQTPAQVDAYLQSQFCLKSWLRSQYPAHLPAMIEMRYYLSYAGGSWPRDRTWQTRTTHYLDGQLYNKPYLRKEPGAATTGWIVTDKLAEGKHTFHFVVEYTLDHRGKQVHGKIRSQDYAFAIIAANAPNDLIAGHDAATDRLILRVLQIEEHENVGQPQGIEFGNRPQSDPWAPQITWETGGLHVPVWKVTEPLPVDLCFAVEFEDLATGKKYRGDPLILLKGKTCHRGYLTMKDVHAFAKDRTGFVNVRVVLRPSRALAYSDPAVTQYFPGLIRRDLRVRLGAAQVPPW